MAKNIGKSIRFRNDLDYLPMPIAETLSNNFNITVHLPMF